MDQQRPGRPPQLLPGRRSYRLELLRKRPGNPQEKWRLADEGQAHGELRDQCVAQVKGERNHPAIQIWSIENEFAFINLINLLGNSPLMDQYEAEIAKCHDAVMAADPTRSVMTDGGGAMKNNTLGVHGDHYVATLDARYPDLAYEPFVEGGGRGRWKWDMNRPRYIGEDFFATRHQSGRLRHVGWRDRVPGQGRDEGSRRHLLPHAAGRLPLGRALCRLAPVAGRRRRPALPYRQCPPRGPGPPVGLDVRLRPERQPHLRPLQ